MASPILFLLETAIGALMELTACIIFIYLLLKFCFSSTRLILEISPSMIQYIIFEIITTFFALLYLAYLSIFWDNFQNKYNGFVLYYLGALQTVAITSKPIAVFFLGIDRICCVLFPFVYFGKKKYFPLVGTFIFVIIIIAINLSLRILNSLPKSETTMCSAFGCMTSAESGVVYSNIRYILGGMNLVLGIILAVLIKKKLNLSNLKVR